MTSPVVRRALIVALIVSSAACRASAVPTGPIDLVAADTAPGLLKFGDNRVAVANQAPAGNPLWAIPLKELSATRDRPIFSPSRRSPAPAVAASSYTPPPQPAKPAEPDRPQLSLVGTIAGDREGFGIFLDRSANTVLRLKTGEEHKGWVLREVRSRETVLEKGDKTSTLALPVLPRVSPTRTPDDDKNLNRSSH
jgi:general secretion pathway protein N